MTPTSAILGSEDASVKSHLTNIYSIKVEGKDYAVIRTGVINTMQRADELIKLLTDTHAAISIGPPPKTNFQMRILSQQLNSHENEGEKEMIESQHALIAYVDEKLQAKKVGEIMHINTPSNRWYTATTREYGGWLRHFPFGILGKGEQLSKEQNIDSWSTMVRWVAADLGLKDVPSCSSESIKVQQRIQEKLARVAILETEIHKIDAELENPQLPNKEQLLSKKQIIESNIKRHVLKIADARVYLRAQLANDYQYFANQSTLRTLVEPRELTDEDKKALQMASLMCQILGSQLGLPGKQLDRGKEGMAIQLLSGMLGVTSAMNCKSGLGTHRALACCQTFYGER